MDDINFDAIVDKRLAAKEVERSVSYVANQIPEDKREAFQNEYKELVEGKKITPQNVDKYIRLAAREVMPEQGGHVDMVKAMAT